MLRYSLELTTRKYVKGYEVLSSLKTASKKVARTS